MIQPTIGRVVWFWLAKPSPQTQPLAAMVTKVNADDNVNLVVFDTSGVPSGELHVRLLQGEEAPSGVPYCEWMPYQKGQAAKTEALEAKVA